MATWLGRFAAVFSLVLLSAPLAAQATERINVATGGQEGNGYTSSAAVSADGRFVAFASDATNLVAGDTNADTDIFLRDRLTSTTRRMSLASDGSQAADSCGSPAISADGRFVAFQTRAGNLAPGDTNGVLDVYLRDRLSGTTELVSVAIGGGAAGGDSAGPQLSGDGRFVVFQSVADDLVPGDLNVAVDVFVRDRLLGTMERISHVSGATQPVITPDGRYVAFLGGNNVFVQDRQTGTMELVSVDMGGQPAGGSAAPSITADGRFVAFSSTASDLVPGDTTSFADIFVRDRLLGTTEVVSVNTGEGQASYPSTHSAISDDGRWVAFDSFAWNLVAGDTNQDVDVFLRDRLLGTLVRVSVDSAGAQSDGDSLMPAMSADGRWIFFQSVATNLVEGDGNSGSDIFVRDRDATGFTSLCDPGVLVANCPCSNPPSGPTRGCDNSSATGGATLAASGTTSLSADTLVFTTSGQKPTALSIVLQGRGFVTDGVAFGQGIRCVGGLLKRLYSKSAVGGSVTAPDFGAGDLSVSAQSAAKGDVIQPGQPRWYIVYYRDNTVLGGCAPTANFNATQTGQVSWAP